MKIRKVTCWVLRIPFTFPLVREQQHALGNFIEIETDDGHKGHALSTYPLKYGIREFINREAAPVIEGLDAMRPEDVRKRLFWATARKYFMGAWNNAASLIDIALWDIKGKALGQPIWKLLGRRASEAAGVHHVRTAALQHRGADRSREDAHRGRPDAAEDGGRRRNGSHRRDPRRADRRGHRSRRRARARAARSGRPRRSSS